MASSHLHNRLNVLTVQSLQGAPSTSPVNEVIRQRHHRKPPGYHPPQDPPQTKWQLQETVVNLQPPP